MQHNLAGKRAIVGGGSQGIGRAVAEALAAQGAEVLILARGREALASAAAALPTPLGQKHRWISVDNAQPEELSASVAAELLAWGDAHILVNNTGGPKAGPLLEASPEAFLSAFTNHLIVNQRLAQLVVPGMRACGLRTHCQCGFDQREGSSAWLGGEQYGASRGGQLVEDLGHRTGARRDYGKQCAAGGHFDGAASGHH